MLDETSHIDDANSLIAVKVVDDELEMALKGGIDIPVMAVEQVLLLGGVSIA